MITVALTDDEPLFTAGLAMVLEAAEGIEVVWQAHDGFDALHRHAAQPPDVLLLDIRMPGVDGLETTRRLARAGTTTRIVMLTTFSADEYVLTAIEEGASGFLLKNTPPEELVEAIRTVARGDAVISPEPTRRLFEAYRGAEPTGRRGADPGARRCYEALTAREREILELVGTGLTNQEICERLWLSMSTVKTHVSTLMAKTGSRDRVQLVLFALRTGTATI